MNDLTPQEAEASTDSPQVGERLGAAVLLGGGLTPSPLGGATGCSVLDLLIAPRETVLDRWMQRLGRLNGMAVERLPVIVAAGGSAPAPKIVASDSRCRFELVLHDSEYRGAAGVLHDVTHDLGDESLLLVTEAARCPDFDVGEVVAHHLAERHAVTVAVNADGSPAGLYLLTRHLLGLVQVEGYMDLKEQWLGKVIAAGHKVGVYRITDGCCRPLRTREQLLAAARASAAGGRASDGVQHFSNVSGAISSGTFQCVSPEASVAAEAVVIDSIIMPGARVGRACVVARSIVCAGASLADGEVLVDSVRSADARGGNGHSRTAHHRRVRP